ncbi:MAG: C39 family peptidase [Candidatus Thiodiazotropha taylori]
MIKISAYLVNIFLVILGCLSILASGGDDSEDESCENDTYSISGVISGIDSGHFPFVILVNEVSGTNTTIRKNGSFTVQGSSANECFSPGYEYNLSIYEYGGGSDSQPYNCSIENSSGIVSSDNIENISVSCNINPNYSSVETPSPSIPNEVALSVPFDFQENQNWCWAATIKMVSDYYGHYIEQCTILSYWLGQQCCLYPYICDVTGSTGQIISTLNANNLHSQWMGSALTLGQLKTELSEGRPVIAGYRNSFSGHVVVIYGYTSRNEVLIYDPYFGAFQIPYGSSFQYGSGYSTMYWSETFYGIRP